MLVLITGACLSVKKDLKKRYFHNIWKSDEQHFFRIDPDLQFLPLNNWKVFFGYYWDTYTDKKGKSVWLQNKLNYTEKLCYGSQQA